MIIRCEECETRFRLDEARIPERGARVRCSRCDHSFIVRPPSSDDADRDAAAAHARDAAEAAARATPPSAPPEASAGDSATTTSQASPEFDDDEDDWEFGPSEADVPSPASAAPPEPAAEDDPTPDTPAADEERAPAAPPVEPPAPSPPQPAEAPAAAAVAAPAPEPTSDVGESPGEDSLETDPSEASGGSMSDLLTSEDGDDRAVAASAPAPEAPAPASPTPEGVADDGEVSSFDIDDPFGVSGADLSGTGTLESDDRDFEAAAAGVAADDEDANGDSLAAVGDPSSWNLLADEEATPDPASLPPDPPPEAIPPPAATPPPSPVEADEPLFPPSDLFAEGPEAPAEDSGGVDYLADFLAGDDAAEADETPPSAWAQQVGRAASVASWPLALLLIALAGWNLLRPAAPTPSSRTLALDDGFVIQGLASRVVENTLGGPLLVVSGELHNTGPVPQALESALTVTLLDVEGNHVDGVQALMAPTPATAVLREQDPALLRGQGDYAARRAAFVPIAPGDTRSYTAVFDGIPGGATAFSLELQRLPGPPAAPAFVGPSRDGTSGEELRTDEIGAPVETATALPSAALPSPE